MQNSKLIMIKDRLPELLSKIEAERNEDFTVYIDQDDFLDEFFVDASNISETISDIKLCVEEVRRLQSSMLLAPLHNESTRRKLEYIDAEIERKSSNVRTFIKALQSSIEKDDLDHPKRLGVYKRIRETQHLHLFTIFFDVIVDYNEVQINHREKFKAKIQRQLQIIDKTVEPEELEDMFDQGNVQIFTQNIILDIQAAKDTLEKVESRNEEILRLAKSIQELHGMFVLMAMLVEGQREIIDRIEYHVEQAKEYVETGIEDIKKAYDYRTKVRSKKHISIICMFVLFSILLIWSITFVI